jgi:hypothetical protein
MIKVWCVKHNSGWCAAKQNRKFSDRAFSVPTKCGYFVALPWGCEEREPTCLDCLEILEPAAARPVGSPSHPEVKP